MPKDKNRIKVLIVDDEKKACTNLQNLLTEYVGPDVDIAGVAYNTQEAETLVNEHHPEAIFLDIEMPNENAFHFLDRIAPFHFEVIFVTAYDEYAVRAFRLNAIDYILKPISIHELKVAVQKLKDRIHFKKMVGDRGDSYARLSEQINSKVSKNRIILRDNQTTEVVDFKDIYFVEAQSSYSKIVFFKEGVIKEMVISNPLSEYEDLLPEHFFYRVHRSYLVNCAHIKKMVNDGTGKILVDGDYSLPVSRRRQADLLHFLESNNYL